MLTSSVAKRVPASNLADVRSLPPLTAPLPKARLPLSGKGSSHRSAYRQSDVAESPFGVFVDVSPSSGATRQGIAWEGMGAEVIHAETRDRFEFRFRAPFHTLVIYEQGVRREGETVVEGLPRSTLRDVARKLAFVPADHEYRDSYSGSAPVRLMLFFIDETVFRRGAEVAQGDKEPAPRMLFEDPSLWATATKLKAALEGEGSAHASYLEALALVLAHELTQLKPQAESRQVVRGGLAAWQQRVVTKYIAEHLAERISLATLAEMTSLSSFYFCRAFRQSVGVPPQRYHMQLRIARAKELLAERKYSVAEIGFTLGFRDSSCFTAAFRRVTGQTPTSYVRCVV